MQPLPKLFSKVPNTVPRKTMLKYIYIYFLLSFIIYFKIILKEEDARIEYTDG